MMRLAVLFCLYGNSFLGGAALGAAVGDRSIEFGALALIAFMAVYISHSVYTDLTKKEQVNEQH